VITDVLIIVFFSGLGQLLGLLPGLPIPAWLEPDGALHDGAATLAGAIAGMSHWLPVGAVLEVIPAFVAVTVGLAAFSGIMFVIRLVRG
jgi:hypothetical protein